MSKVSPFQAAVDYHVACELYDRSVCTGPMGRDGILPANAWEKGRDATEWLLAEQGEYIDE